MVEFPAIFVEPLVLNRYDAAVLRPSSLGGRNAGCPRHRRGGGSSPSRLRLLPPPRQPPMYSPLVPFRISSYSRNNNEGLALLLRPAASMTTPGEEQPGERPLAGEPVATSAP